MERKAWQPQLDSIRLNATSFSSIKCFSLGLFIHLFLHISIKFKLSTYYVSSIYWVWGYGRKQSWFFHSQSLYLEGKSALPTTLPTSLIAYFFCSIIANCCKPIKIFFTSLQGKTQCPIFFYHYQRCPSVCGPSLFRYMYSGMNSLLEAMFPVIVKLQNKRKDS